MRRLRDTWPYSWSDLVAFVATYVVLTGVFVAIGWPLRERRDNWVQRTDDRVANWMVEHRGDTVNLLSNLGSGLANTIVKVVVTAVIVFVMVRVWHRWFEAAYVAITLVLEASVFIMVTTIVGRPRPDVPQLGHSSVDSSFPSGHVAAAVVYATLVVVVFWHTRRRAPRVLACVGSVVVALIVAASRVHRGLHYLSDVIGGAALGMVVLAITTTIALRAQRRFESRHPGQPPAISNPG